MKRRKKGKLGGGGQEWRVREGRERERGKRKERKGEKKKEEKRKEKEKESPSCSQAHPLLKHCLSEKSLAQVTLSLQPPSSTVAVGTGHRTITDGTGGGHWAGLLTSPGLALGPEWGIPTSAAKWSIFVAWVTQTDLSSESTKQAKKAQNADPERQGKAHGSVPLYPLRVILNSIILCFCFVGGSCELLMRGRAGVPSSLFSLEPALKPRATNQHGGWQVCSSLGLN